MQFVSHKSILSGSSALILACCMGCSSTDLSQPSPQPAPQSGAGTSAGSASASAQADVNADKNPVLRIDIEAGHVITVYEPEPGFLVMVESQQRSQQPILSSYDHPDALEVFSRLRPGEAAPTALLDAYKRAQDSAKLADVAKLSDAVAEPESRQAYDPGGHPAWEESAVPEVRTDGVGVVQQAHSQSNPQDFVANHAGCDWAPRWSICRVNWGGGFHSGPNSGTSMTSVVDHFAGNGITVKLFVNFATAAFPQSVGTIVTYTGGLGITGLTPRHIEILDAAGDSFHAGTRLF